MTTPPPVCNYEGSDYQQSFWEQGGREYEDHAEAIALKRMLPTPAPSASLRECEADVAGGARESRKLMLELGAGAGRNTLRYAGFERIVLLDYSTTQLMQAQEKLGSSNKYIYVAADIYRLPFRDRQFDAATMIRVLHHMADAPKALKQIRNVLRPGAVFILEFANKLNFKSILRYLLGRQKWNPFTLEPVEFAKLNFDFHPKAIRNWLGDLGFSIEKTLTVSHFRLGLLKRIVPARLLAALDGIFQPTGAIWQFTPSVFVKACRGDLYDRPEAGIGISPFPTNVIELFKCPDCEGEKLVDGKDYLHCPICESKWAVQDGIYDFRGRMK